MEDLKNTQASHGDVAKPNALINITQITMIIPNWNWLLYINLS